MKVIKHMKKGNICYTSHIDSMRVLQRTLVRAHINVKMSEGFNPHPITYTSHPLPLGVQSEEEFFVIANEDMTASEVLEAFNKNIPDGMKAIACYDCTKNPNFAKNINFCEYIIKGNFLEFKDEIECLAKKESFVISYMFKGERKEQEIAPLIHSIKVEEQGIVMVLAAGNPNLRPDRVTTAINEMILEPIQALCDNAGKTTECNKIGVNDIIRSKQLVISGEKYLTADEFLQEFLK